MLWNITLIGEFLHTANHQNVCRQLNREDQCNSKFPFVLHTIMTVVSPTFEVNIERWQKRRDYIPYRLRCVGWSNSSCSHQLVAKYSRIQSLWLRTEKIVLLQKRTALLEICAGQSQLPQKALINAKIIRKTLGVINFVLRVQCFYTCCRTR